MKYSANALISAAKRDTPRSTLERDVVASLGAGTLAASFGTKLWAALKHAAVTKAGIATIAFAAATGGYAAGRLQERAERAEPAVAIATTVRMAATGMPALTLAPTPTPTIAGTSTSTSTSASTSTSTSTRSVVAAPPQPSLADEIAGIQRARALLVKNPDGAIAALDVYDRMHPSGTMTEEALALRVRADRLAGNDVGAAEALTKLETRFPESIHLAALRR